MQVNVSARHTKVSATLKSLIEGKLERIHRHFGELDRVRVHFAEHEYRDRNESVLCELVVTGRTTRMVAKSDGRNLVEAFDRALDKLDHQARSAKSLRETKRHIRAAS